MAALPPRTKHTQSQMCMKGIIIPSWAEGKSAFCNFKTQKPQTFTYILNTAGSPKSPAQQSTALLHCCMLLYLLSTALTLWTSPKQQCVFPMTRWNTEIREFPYHVTNMRQSAGCQNMIRHLSSILFLLKAETLSFLVIPILASCYLVNESS